LHLEDIVFWIRRKVNSKWISKNRIKKVVNFCTKLIVSIVFLGLVSFLIFKNCWRLSANESDLTQAVDIVNLNDPLPKKFTEVLDIVKPKRKDSFNQSFAKFLFAKHGAFYLKTLNCNCFDLNFHLNQTDFKNKFQRYSFESAVEDLSSAEACFDFRFNKFLQDSKRLNFKPYTTLHEKPIEAWDEDEILELIILSEAPSRYDKHKNPEKFKRRFKTLKREIQTYKVK